MGEARATVMTRELYRSSNGDRWYLAHDALSKRVFIRHEPNVPSGGQSTNIEIGTFLVQGGTGPEHHELLRLIGTLVSIACLAVPRPRSISARGRGATFVQMVAHKHCAC
jgi:hypothetical protein